MVDDAVRDYRGEVPIRKRQRFRVNFLKRDSLVEPGFVDVGAAKGPHVLRQVHSGDTGAGMLAAKLNGDLSRAGSNVQNWTIACPECQEVRDKKAVDLGVVHRVVVARFRSGVHHFGLENTWQHMGLRTFGLTSRAHKQAEPTANAWHRALRWLAAKLVES